MLFSENERRELAEFFAKRFSEPQVRSMLARQAGLKEDEEIFDANYIAASRVTLTEIIKLLRKHGGKTAEELKAEGK